MLKHFTIVSDTLTYSASIAQFEFPRRTKGRTRCAVIGWDADAANASMKLANVVHFLSIGPRQYVQGDPVVFGLFTGVAPGAGNDVTLGRPFFPGDSVLLPDGTTCGAMMINPGERIELRLADLTGGSAELRQVILHCVEFPDDCQDPAEQRDTDAAWERLQRGDGETLLYGNALSYSAAGITPLEAVPKGPNAQAYRRQEVRGACYDASGALQEDDFTLLQVLVYSQTERPTANAGVPARMIVGHGALPKPGVVRVDLRNDERQYIEVTAPTPGAARVARFATVLQGRPEAGKYLTAAEAIS